MFFFTRCFSSPIHEWCALFANQLSKCCGGRVQFVFSAKTVNIKMNILKCQHHRLLLFVIAFIFLSAGVTTGLRINDISLVAARDTPLSSAVENIIAVFNALENVLATKFKEVVTLFCFPIPPFVILFAQDSVVIFSVCLTSTFTASPCD